MSVSLLRFDPFREFERLTDQVWGLRPRMPVLAMDAFRRPDELVLHFDLPGVDPASVEVTVEKNVLTVGADRAAQHEEGDEVIATERPTGHFTRQLLLGDGLDTEHVHAAYDAGVLTLTFPVAEQVKTRRIEVTAGAPHERAIDANVSDPEGTSTAA